MLAGLRQERGRSVISVVVLYDRVAERGGCGRSGVAEILAMRDEHISWWLYRCWRSHSKQIKCPSGMFGAMYEAQTERGRSSRREPMRREERWWSRARWNAITDGQPGTQSSARFPRVPKPGSMGAYRTPLRFPPRGRPLALDDDRFGRTHPSFSRPSYVQCVI